MFPLFVLDLLFCFLLYLPFLNLSPFFSLCQFARIKMFLLKSFILVPKMCILGTKLYSLDIKYLLFLSYFLYKKFSFHYLLGIKGQK